MARWHFLSLLLIFTAACNSQIFSKIGSTRGNGQGYDVLTSHLGCTDTGLSLQIVADDSSGQGRAYLVADTASTYLVTIDDQTTVRTYRSGNDLQVTVQFPSSARADGSYSAAITTPSLQKNLDCGFSVQSSPKAIQSLSAVAFAVGTGAHLPYGTVQCSSLGAFFEIGNLADCGGGTCSGAEVACASYLDQNNNAGTQSVLVDYYVTPDGSHNLTGPGCGVGYVSIAKNADCAGGSCLGNQNHCAATTTAGSLAAGATYVRDLFFTPSNLHAFAGPGCPPGYQPVGHFADCGGGTCWGNQQVCALKATF